MLKLTECIGTGNDRSCWRHPRDPALCIKVAKPEQERPQNEIDFHYGMHLARRGVHGLHLARMHGWVKTDRGPGLVFDLVRDPDGTTSPTLLRAVRTGAITLDQARRLVDEAFAWLLSNRVILADFDPSNMLIQRLANGRRHLVFIDGLGTRNLGFKYWLYRTIPFRALMKVREFHRMTLALLDTEAAARSRSGAATGPSHGLAGP